MVKCTACGRVFDDKDQYCPSCGERVVKKFNPIILSKKDYDGVRSNENYNKCEGCGALSYYTYRKCPSCQKDMPKVKRVEEREPVEWNKSKKKGLGLSSALSSGFNDLLSNGIDAFKDLPKKYQFGALAVLMILIGAIIPWGAVGLGMLGSGLIIGGLVLVLLTGGLFKKKGGETS